jgi:hypothetical protein
LFVKHCRTQIRTRGFCSSIPPSIHVRLSYRHRSIEIEGLSSLWASNAVLQRPALLIAIVDVVTIAFEALKSELGDEFIQVIVVGVDR